jgi:hypothetical protein
VIDFFKYPTIRSLSAHLDGRGQSTLDRTKFQAAAARRRARTPQPSGPARMQEE